MSTEIAVADWIKRVADDERRRDAVRVREEETAARKADLSIFMASGSSTNCASRWRETSKRS